MTDFANDNDGYGIEGVYLDAHRFIGKVQGSKLFDMIPNPMLTEKAARRKEDPKLQKQYEIRSLVQRQFAAGRKKNVSRYADYLVMIAGARRGLAPPIIIWSQEKLSMNERGDLIVPYGVLLVAVDGETQLAARYHAAANGHEDLMNHAEVPVLICHGRDPEWARQVFHDVNVLGIRPSTSIALTMDAYDPVTAMAREVEENVGQLFGRVDKQNSKLPRKTDNVITLGMLRNSLASFVDGQMRSGARQIQMDDKAREVATDGAIDWYSELLAEFESDISNSRDTVFRQGPIWIALGRLGHDQGLHANADAADRKRRIHRVMTAIGDVNWTKEAWVNLMFRRSPVGTLVQAGSANDVTKTALSALDKSNPAMAKQIRQK